jgi:hypothetical protein
VSVKRHCCETLAGLRQTVLAVGAATANAIAAAVTANPVPLARVYALRRHDGQLLQKVLAIPVWSIWVLVGHSPVGMSIRECSLTGKGLLNVHHFPRTRLHKPTPPLPRPFQTCSTAHNPALLQIALVACDDLHGWGSYFFFSLHATEDCTIILFNAILFFDVNHVHEVVKRIQGRGIGDVVDKEKGVGLKVGGGPEATVLFLTGCVGEGKEVWKAVNCASDGVRVFNSRVVSRMVDNFSQVNRTRRS